MADKERWHWTPLKFSHRMRLPRSGPSRSAHCSVFLCKQSEGSWFTTRMEAPSTRRRDRDDDDDDDKRRTRHKPTPPQEAMGRRRRRRRRADSGENISRRETLEDDHAGPRSPPANDEEARRESLGAAAVNHLREVGAKMRRVFDSSTSREGDDSDEYDGDGKRTRRGPVSPPSHGEHDLVGPRSPPINDEEPRRESLGAAVVGRLREARDRVTGHFTSPKPREGDDGGGKPLTRPATVPTAAVVLPPWPGLFGMDLGSLMARNGPGSELEVPRVMAVLCDAIVRCGGLHTEGIFRLAVGATEKHASMARLHLFDYHAVEEDMGNDPHLYCVLLKEWIKCLPQPLICNADACLALDPHATADEARPIVKALWQGLGVHERAVLRRLLMFVKAGCLGSWCGLSHRLTCRS